MRSAESIVLTIEEAAGGQRHAVERRGSLAGYSLDLTAACGNCSARLEKTQLANIIHCVPCAGSFTLSAS